MEGKGDCDMKPPENPTACLSVEKFRKLVRVHLDANANESALFWADKVASMSGGDPRDVYWLAQCMFRSRQYHRAAILIRNKGLDKTQPLCQWLAGLCLLEAREYNDALLILTGEDEQIGFNRSNTIITPTSFLPTPNIPKNCILEGFTPKALQSAIELLKGRVYEKLDNRSRAAECFKQALKFDVYCYEAFQALVQHQMLTAVEEKELLSSLPFKDQCGDNDLLPTVYEVLLNKYQRLPELPQSLPHPRLSDNLDLEVARAERLYYSCAYRQCFLLTEDILKKDPYHTTCLPIHISCLVELKKINKLFYLAHDLVDLMPERAVSWFAVGCYYFLTGKRDPARRYLGKATSLDRLFGPAWLAYGHSFAAENEHDQAMAAYFSATKLMKGCHLPLLYIGLECGLTNNIRLAERFFTQAQSIAPHDPFVIHEMGIIAFQNQDYNMAEKHFLTALSQVHEINQSIIAEKWEPLLNNLGHTCRKLKKYEESLRYHQQALVLSPQNASTLACIGFVHSLQGNLTEAVDTFHKALGLRRDDSFSLTMLANVIEQLMETTPAFPGAPDTVPGFDTMKTQSTTLHNNPLFDMFTPLSSPSSPPFEIEMQDSFQDENTS
ncbi:cell division cycle protein 16 homolog [Macrosteles quadrilineatus]|uniref:cell division cycle protein 16 homolog n=1 Tax=Macrosteles quadrilineatus TaxID=74068 RepID=UPI0023E2131D|nr:cell division cycle protein 16 homolog [Macrosteles quadrilineatus]